MTKMMMRQFLLMTINVYLEQFIGARPLVRVLGKTQFDKITELLRPFGWAVKERRVGLLDLQQDPHRRHLVIGRLHLGELNQGYAERPNVDLVVIGSITERFAQDNLKLKAMNTMHFHLMSG